VSSGTSTPESPTAGSAASDATPKPTSNGQDGAKRKKHQQKAAEPPVLDSVDCTPPDCIMPGCKERLMTPLHPVPKDLPKVDVI